MDTSTRRTWLSILWLVGGMLFVLLVISACSSYADKHTEADKKACLESVKHYLPPDEAQRFCNQPADCRKWWDDMTPEERDELHPPRGFTVPEFWDQCRDDPTVILRIVHHD